MKKRIFRSTMLLSSLGIIFVSLVLCLVFYSRLAFQLRVELNEWAHQFVNDDLAAVMEEIKNSGQGSIRVSLIRKDGSVAFDNMSDAGRMDNHLNRTEIREALARGSAEADRYSDTIGTRIFYYAVRLTDGSVLRAAKTVGSIWSVFAGALPAVVLFVAASMLLSHFAAGWLARRVVMPIIQANWQELNGGVPYDELHAHDQPTPYDELAPYDELIPYVKTIAQNRKQMALNKIQLQSRNETINEIMNNMDEGVVLLDMGGNILSINKAASEIFAVRDSMEGRNALELLRDVDFAEKIRRALEGVKSEMSYHKQKKEYRLLLSPVAGTGVVVLFLDVTEKSQTERLRREFSANVSHELKTPLTSIYGLAEMLKEKLVKDADKELFYGKIMSEASRLIALIEDIILLSELDEDRVQGRFETLDLAQIAAECRAALERQAMEQSVSIHLYGGGKLMANRSLIYDMFHNLMDNAIKYNRPGGKVEVSISENDRALSIVVADNGMGISDSDRERIFERFYRADKSRSRKSGGTGLGLAIVKHIVLVHGGAINLESRENEGSRFVIELPAERS